MLKKPIVLAIIKMDLPQSNEIYEETVDKLKNEQGLFCCATSLVKYFSVYKLGKTHDVLSANMLFCF